MGISAFLESARAVQDMYSELSADLGYSMEELLHEFDGQPLDKYDQRISFYQTQIEAVNDTDTQVLLANSYKQRILLRIKIQWFLVSRSFADGSWTVCSQLRPS